MSTDLDLAKAYIRASKNTKEAEAALARSERDLQRWQRELDQSERNLKSRYPSGMSGHVAVPLQDSGINTNVVLVRINSSGQITQDLVSFDRREAVT